ncbi:MAG: cysteine--tRNA ligase, partial [Tissierellia bacterium]|nr:cysteine--tRNA ligase [Tissierellia bacterium]
ERLYNGKQKLEDLLKHTGEKDEDEKDEQILEDLSQCKERFIQVMEDDLNTADAVTEVFNLVRIANTQLSGNSNKRVVEYAYQLLMELTQVLGILHRKEEELEDEIVKLIAEREEARKNKDFQRSDEIRDLLKEKGILIEDTRTGTKWKRI